MQYIAGLLAGGGNINWQIWGQLGNRATGITITFSYVLLSRVKAQRDLSAALCENGISWLRPSKTEDRWIFDSQGFKAQFTEFSDENWLDGTLLLQMDHEVKREEVFDREVDRGYCIFELTPDLVEEQRPRRIFLSHRGSDKPMVRRYQEALKNLGLSVWLDEDALLAGTELERGLLRGFQ